MFFATPLDAARDTRCRASVATPRYSLYLALLPLFGAIIDDYFTRFLPRRLEFYFRRFAPGVDLRAPRRCDARRCAAARKMRKIMMRRRHRRDSSADKRRQYSAYARSAAFCRAERCCALRCRAQNRYDDRMTTSYYARDDAQQAFIIDAMRLRATGAPDARDAFMHARYAQIYAYAPPRHRRRMPAMLLRRYAVA